MTYYFDQDPEPQPPPPDEFDDPSAYAPRPWRLMFDDPPEEIDRGEEILAARDQRWTGRAIILATVALAIFNAASITSWASSLPPNWSTETVRAVAGVWSARLADLGLDQPRAVIRRGYEAQKAKRWK